jgi:nucleoside-diphosphate-sugar epimerase
MTSAFVAGATGLTGREVVRVLAQRGIATFAHVRPDSPRLAEWQKRLSAQGAHVDTTPWDEAALRRRLAQVAPDVVFALLGTTRARGKKAQRETGQPDTYESVDYGLSARLLHATRASCQAARFVYLSAIGVSQSSRGAYYRARFKVEQELRESGLRYTIVRPSFIIGERDDPRPGERLGSKVADAALRLAGVLGGAELRDRYQSIAAPELAEALVRLAFDATAENRIVEADQLRGRA